MSDMRGTDVMQPPSEEQLEKDIAHFERQVKRLASPSSMWEQGALNCYQVLARERRRMLDQLRASVSG